MWWSVWSVPDEWSFVDIVLLLVRACVSAADNNQKQKLIEWVTLIQLNATSNIAVEKKCSNLYKNIYVIIIQLAQRTHSKHK